VELVAAPALPNPYQAVTEQTERILVQRDNHFSNSQIRNYLTCPRKYFYEKVARVTLSEEDRDDSGFALGNLMHEVLCAALGNGSTKNVDLREETFEFFAQRWAGIEHRALTILEHALAGTPCDLGGGQRYSPDKSYRDTLGGGLSALIAEQTARTMITRWVAAENKHLKTSVGRRPFLLEHEFSFVIDGMTITGRIDRVDLVIDGSRPRIEVIDYKTTSAKPPSGNDYLVEMGMPKFTKEKTRIDAALAPEATNYQTLMYLSTALPHVDGAYPTNAMRYVYLNEDHKEFGIFRRIEVVADTTMVEQFSANKPTVLSVARAEFDNVLQGALRNTMIDMRHTPYPIKPGRHCKTCLYFSICDATVDNTNAEEE
jgi:RecB family exonuclease